MEDTENAEILRIIEDMRYPTKCPDPDKTDIIPTVMQMTMMEEAYMKASMDTTLVFPDMERKYFHIYIWNYIRYGKKPVHFVCSRGCRLSEREESLLLDVCVEDESASVDRKLLQNVMRSYKDLVPDANPVYYRERPLLSVLHMYYCLFPGIHELLFKAGFPYLAASIHKIESCNLLPVMTKGAPADLFPGFTNKLLRLLDSEWGMEELLTEKKRKNVLEIYRLFGKNLGGYRKIGHSQWCYLKMCYQSKTVFDMRMFRFFGKDATDRLFRDYFIFRAKSNLINRQIKWVRTVRSGRDLYKYMDEADAYLTYLVRRSEYDQMMREQDIRLSYMDYSDLNFAVIHPKTVEEIFEESRQQHNCLKLMFREICGGHRDVGFMRAVNRPDRSLITFEIADGKILQVLGKYNKTISASSREMSWFREVYVKKKGFRFFKTPDFCLRGIDENPGNGDPFI